MPKLELSDIESNVLEVIKEYLNKNRVFNAKEIIPHITNGLKKFQLKNPPNESGIQKILWKFIRERIVVPGSKFTENNILENIARKSIYNHINKNPGTHLREIMEKLELSSHSTMWHTNLLIRFEKLRASKIGKYRALFNNNLPNTLDNEIFQLGNKKVNDIIEIMVKNKDGITANQIAEGIGIHYNTVTKNLHKLNEMELLYQKDENGQVLYLINSKKLFEIIDGIESLKASIK